MTLLRYWPLLPLVAVSMLGAALWVALDRNASLRAALAVVEAKISTHKEVQGYEDAARKATDAALIDLLSTD